METRREQIYSTAGALFSRRGYAATSVRDIARELDLQGGSLYAHIASKEEVLWALVSDAAERFFAAVRPLALSGAPAAERLRGMIQAHIRVVTDQLERATSTRGCTARRSRTASPRARSPRPTRSWRRC